MNLLARADLIEGVKQGLLLGAAAWVLAGPAPRRAPMPPSLQATAAQPAAPDFGATPAPADVRQLVDGIVASQDNGKRPFAIIDKRGASIYVFDAGGRLLGASPVLLGAAIGDGTVAGIGNRPIDDVRPQERTTPAGRFRAQPGIDDEHQSVVWVDYQDAVAMHRVFLGDPAEHRLQRLASPLASQRRISWGCINLPASFFDTMVWPWIGVRRGIVYVMPEVETLVDVFPALTRAPAG